MVGASAYLTEQHAPPESLNTTTMTAITSQDMNNTNSTDEESGGGGVSVQDYLPLIGVNLAAVGYHIGLSPIPWSYCG